MNPLPKAFLSASVLAMGLVAGPVMAQNAVPQAPAPVHPATPTIQPNEAQLQKFAKASKEVAVVADEYQTKSQATPDAGTRQRLMQEADEKMIKLARVDGLSVDEYNGISVAVQRDPKLRQRVTDLVNRAGGTHEQ